MSGLPIDQPCRIINVERPDYCMIVFDNSSNEGTPIGCIPLAEAGIDSFFRIVQSGEDRYHISSVPHGWSVSANPDNLQHQNYPFTSMKPFDWAIESAGSGIKIHIPSMDDCLYMPNEDKPQIRVQIRGAKGNGEEIWKAEPING